MKLTTFRNAIRLMMIALMMTTVAVGCGDGKSKHRQPIRKGAKAQIDPKTGVPITPAAVAEAQKKAAEETKTKSSQIQQIDGQLAQMKNGNALDKNQLEDGVYKLETVTSHFKYILKAEDIRVIRSHGIANNMLTDIANSFSSTGMPASYGDLARNVEAAMTINVDKSSGDFTLLPNAFEQKKLVRTEVVQGNQMKLDMKDTLVDVTLPLKASLINILSGASEKKADNRYSIVDEEGKEVNLVIFKNSDSRVNLVFEIVESENSAKKLNTPTVVRNIVLTYAFTKAVKKVTEAAPDQAADQGQTPQQVEVTGSSTTDPNAAPMTAPPMDDDQSGQSQAK